MSAWHMTLEYCQTHDPAENSQFYKCEFFKYLTHYLYMWYSNTTSRLKQDNNKPKHEISKLRKTPKTPLLDYLYQ